MIMSHLASADQPTSQFNKIQREKFKKITKNFENFRLSLANSHATINFKDSKYDITRSGGALFGTIVNKNLKNIINFKSRILQIKEIIQITNSLVTMLHFNQNKKKLLS